MYGEGGVWSPVHMLDPICTYIFCIIVLFTTVGISKMCISILMEGTPVNFKIEKFEEELKKLEGVRNTHNLHVWNLNREKIAMVAHVIAEKEYHESILR